MPGLLGSFIAPGAQGQPFGFASSMAVDDLGVELDEWVQMNSEAATDMSWE